jgi:T4-like virus Myoviridae tail sheath stabiliser
MFGQAPYYFKTIRNCVIAFGSLFQDMTMVKYTNGTTTEQSRLTVPIYYEGKEDFITRVLDNPRLAKPVEIVLPRAGFEIASFRYAPERKLNTYNSITIPGTNGSASQQYQPVPWDLGFKLYLYVRNVEDGTQLIEQILPIFTPNYTLTINYVPELGISRNAPMMLNSVTYEDDYEGDSNDKERTLIWTLDFTMQAQFYGPINTGNVITQVNTNLFINTTLGTNGLASDVEVFLQGGTGNYQVNEFVYQGQNLPDASVIGTVSTWNNTANLIVLANVSGVILDNVALTGATSGATYLVANTTNNIEMATITITPNPSGANASNAFGFDTTIVEYPQTLS